MVQLYNIYLKLNIIHTSVHLSVCLRLNNATYIDSAHSKNHRASNINSASGVKNQWGFYSRESKWLPKLNQIGFHCCSWLPLWGESLLVTLPCSLHAGLSLSFMKDSSIKKSSHSTRNAMQSSKRGQQSVVLPNYDINES